MEEKPQGVLDVLLRNFKTNDEIVFLKTESSDLWEDKNVKDLQKKSRKLKKSGTMTLMIIKKAFSEEEMSFLKVNQVKPDDVFDGHSTTNQKWVSLPEIWRDEEIKLRENDIPYLKSVLRADAEGKTSILNIYWLVFEQKQTLSVLKDLYLPSSSSAVFDYLRSNKEEFAELSERLSKKAKSTKAAVMKTLLIEAKPVLTEDEKKQIWDNQLSPETEIHSEKNTKKQTLVSIPRPYLQEEIELREQRLPYVKFILHCDKNGLLSLIYQIEQWGGDTVIIRESYDSYKSYLMNEFLKNNV